MFIEKTLVDYINLTSEKVPAPGGGSVLALVASLGVALSEMAINFTKDKEAFHSLSQLEKNKLTTSMEKMEKIRLELKKLIDLDSQAFNSVLEAYKLDKNDETRERAIQEGFKEALEVPLQCFRYSFKALKLQYILVKYGDRSLITDSAIGAILSYGAMEGSLYNIKINLNSIRDDLYKEPILDGIIRDLNEGKRYRELILETVDRKLS